MSPWSYPIDVHSGPASGSTVTAVLTLLAILAAECAAIGLSIWIGSRSGRLKPLPGRSRRDRRAAQATLTALDTWLDTVWQDEIAAGHRDESEARRVMREPPT